MIDQIVLSLHSLLIRAAHQDVRGGPSEFLQEKSRGKHQSEWGCVRKKSLTTQAALPVKLKFNNHQLKYVPIASMTLTRVIF